MYQMQTNSKSHVDVSVKLALHACDCQGSLAMQQVGLEDGKGSC